MFYHVRRRIARKLWNITWWRSLHTPLIWSKPPLQGSGCFSSGPGLIPGRCRSCSQTRLVCHSYIPPKWWPRRDILNSHTVSKSEQPLLHCVQSSSSTLLISISLTSNPLRAPRTATSTLGGRPVEKPARCT